MRFTTPVTYWPHIPYILSTVLLVWSGTGFLRVIAKLISMAPIPRKVLNLTSFIVRFGTILLVIAIAAQYLLLTIGSDSFMVFRALGPLMGMKISNTPIADVFWVIDSVLILLTLYMYMYIDESWIKP